MSKSVLLRAVATVSLMATLPLVALADLKVVHKTVSQNLPTAMAGQFSPSTEAPAEKKPSEPVLATTYYKGKKTRVEETGRVVITDNETGTVTAIDTKKKTYTIQKIADMSAQVNPIAEMLEVKVDGGVKPTETKKTIAGREAKLYTSKFTMAMSIKEGAPIPLPAGDGPLMEITMETEQWAAESLQVESTGLAPNMSPIPANMMRMMPGVDSILKKMAEIKGFPLATNVKMTLQSAFPLPGLPEKPIVIKMETVSVTEGALPDTLFQVPAGYKQVELELPAFPGLGGGAR